MIRDFRRAPWRDKVRLADQVARSGAARHVWRAPGRVPLLPESQETTYVIRHIVLFSAKNPADVERIREGLSILKDIPGSRHFEVTCNSKRDGLSKEIDVIVYGEFDSYEALDAYKAHPLYQESITRVRPLRELRFAVDFEADPVTV